MSAWAKTLTCYQKDLNNVTNCTVMIIAAMAPYLDPDDVDMLRKSHLTRRQASDYFWERVKLNEKAITMDKLIHEFGDQNQNGVVEVLKLVKSDLQLIYKLETELEVVLTKQKPNEVVTKPPKICLYQLDENLPRTALSFNITKFDHPSKTRDGAQKDEEYLTCLLQKLNFNVRSFPGERGALTNDELKDVLDTSVKEILKNKPSCLIVFLGSHMKHGLVEVSDGKLINLHTDFIQPIVKNETLQGVPKVFIVQGCRHDETAEPVLDYKDTIICYSTLPGETSTRDALIGSFYIRTLVEVLMREIYRSDLVSMLDQVRKHMLLNFQKNVPEQISHYRRFDFKKSFYFPM